MRLLMGGLGFSSLQVSLAYACFICFEVMILSLFDLHAWRPHDEWYAGDLNEEFKDLQADGVQLVDFPYHRNDLFVSKIGQDRRRHLDSLREAKQDFPKLQFSME